MLRAFDNEGAKGQFMKKILLVFLLLGGLAFTLLVLKDRASGGDFRATGSFADRSHLEKQSLKFMEDLRFKDFQHAGSYHSTEDRKRVNIPAKIEAWFGIKPEQLDIMRYEILKTDIDSTGMRGRTKLKAVVKILNSDQIKDVEIMLYWFKDPAEGWIMELESSL